MLQCAAVALKATLSDEDSSSSLGSRVSSLRKEQMLETLECVLQMGSYLHSVVGIIFKLGQHNGRVLLCLRLGS